MLTSVALSFLLGCPPEKSPVSASRDADGDGYDVYDDCDDTDSAVNPGAGEICDGIDNDCDGDIDEDDFVPTGSAHTSMVFANSALSGFAKTNIVQGSSLHPKSGLSGGAHSNLRPADEVWAELEKLPEGRRAIFLKATAVYPWGHTESDGWVFPWADQLCSLDAGHPWITPYYSKNDSPYLEDWTSVMSDKFSLWFTDLAAQEDGNADVDLVLIDFEKYLSQHSVVTTRLRPAGDETEAEEDDDTLTPEENQAWAAAVDDWAERVMVGCGEEADSGSEEARDRWESLWTDLDLLAEAMGYTVLPSGTAPDNLGEITSFEDISDFKTWAHNWSDDGGFSNGAVVNRNPETEAIDPRLWVWNRAMHDRVGAALHDIVYKTAKAAGFEDVRVSDYDHTAYQATTHNFADLTGNATSPVQGNTVLKAGNTSSEVNRLRNRYRSIVGTHNAMHFYGRLGADFQIQTLQNMDAPSGTASHYDLPIPEDPAPENRCVDRGSILDPPYDWTALLMAQRTIRGMVVAAPEIPRHAWITGDKYSTAVVGCIEWEVAHGAGVSGSAFSEYYIENIFHLGLAGVKDFLLFNPTDKSSDGDDILSNKGATALSDALDEMDELIGFADRERVEVLTVDAPNFKQNLLTGIRNANEDVYRFTPMKGADVVVEEECPATSTESAESPESADPGG